MSLCCECCVLSGRGLWKELITRTQESYRLWCVVVCDLETSRMRRLWPTGGGGCFAPKNQWRHVFDCHTSFIFDRTHLFIYNPKTRSESSSAINRDILNSIRQ